MVATSTAALDETGIAAAIRVAGSQEALAELVGCTQQNVSVWRRRGWVPAGRVIEVEQATGVSRERLIKPQLANLLDTSGI